MDKNKVKFWIDLLMGISFLAVAISGFILWLVLPRGSGKFGSSFIFLREQWLSIHDFGAVILVILIVIHLLLNWIWIKSMISCMFIRNKPNCKI